MTKPLSTWSGVQNLQWFCHILKVFCVCVVWNGTKEIKSKSYSWYLAKPRVYWIFVTKLMGGVNFWLQSRIGDENCYRGTLNVCLKLRISIAIDQTVSVHISS